MQGSLSKWTNVMKGWQYRWFVLDDNAGLFSYYTSKEKMIKGVRRGCVRLKGAVIGIDDEDEATFTVTVDGKTFHFQAKDAQERERWIRALEDTVTRHNQVRRTAMNPRLRIYSGDKSNLSIVDFDKKLSETDTYLELLLGQIKKLQTRMEATESEQSRAELENVILKAQDMSEVMKHAIVLLQIAKNASLPSAVTTGEPKTVSEDGKSISSTQGPGDIDGSPGVKIDRVAGAAGNVPSTLEIGQDILENAKKLGVKAELIPECSYSSSDDDDDFFDAEEQEADVPGVGKSAESLEDPLTPTSLGENIDYDALYEPDEADEEDVDMKSHGSVLTHLLSQVRIGMDLTKIVLPTFILERRSLLEMYSDFFANPDVFLSIADGQTPEDRMVRVLKWYLASFYAGRKSSVAKKPYNPILGETFRCHWKPTDQNAPKQKLSEDGPLPWCRTNDLAFIAEQVSHHPPISAFYAEHPEKKIAVNAHIYTKSSFLGMSVAVHNIGQGKLLLLDHGEEYICTFPSGYGRSILTVPWVELGGKVTITCSKTRYVANIEFKCKQFFSKETNLVTAEVMAPGSDKPVVKIDGKWNGKLMAKWATGRNEVFVDVEKLPVVKKHCKKVVEQEKFESRRLWKDCTYGLKVGDIEAATAAKYALEKRQREEAAERKESGKSWETKLFHPIGQNWQFNEPLEKRFYESSK